jgi:hypothetical protein
MDYYGNSNYSRYSDSSYKNGYYDPSVTEQRMIWARKEREAREDEEEDEEEIS